MEEYGMDFKKIMIAALLLLLAVVSFTVIAPWAGDPANHQHSIEQTDARIESVIKLSGGAAATSATLSMLPGDMCTPLADQLAELASYFLLILSMIYLEKALISLSGFIAFSCLIPIACIFVAAAVMTKKKAFTTIAAKMTLIGIIIFLIVPASVKLSDMVYQTQADKVNNAVEEYDELEIEGDSESGLLNEFSTITTGTVDKITAFIDDLLESLAVMIVTSCVIPILVFAFLVWLVKTIFSSNILMLDPSVLDAIAKKLRLPASAA